MTHPSERPAGPAGDGAQVANDFLHFAEPLLGIERSNFGPRLA